MPLAALVTLPGAPLALPAVTTGIDVTPAELTRLRTAVDDILARLSDGPCVVVAPAPSLRVWHAGELTLKGFGVADPWDAPWQGDEDEDFAARLGAPTATEGIPTEARVVARLIGPDKVTSIVGVSPTVRAASAELLDLEDRILVLVGDLSASVGPGSPRPGMPSNLDDLVENGRVVAAALRRHVHAEQALAAALQVAAEPGAPPLFGEVHVVRGVATLVAASDPVAQRSAP